MTKAEKTRQLIIEQAAPIFNTKGIAATAMSDIMEATGLAKGSLYVHFQNKEELSEAVVAYNLEKLSSKVMAVVNRADSAHDKLLAYMEILSHPLTPPVKGGCPMINFGAEADDNFPAIRRKVNKSLDTAQQMIVDIIEYGIARKEFKASWNAPEFATKMFAMIEGGIILCRAAGSNNKMKIINQILKKEIEEQLR
ncbi:TetR/AcrR family transcriptional regulator [Chitinophaga arvensicola]|uniref:DNA-binding transcriptional regulator, AcrR family n=1 Tax=Chitinophaga arvensicola TaxID=29529 RepID=A0A1I0S954_9BACT|nr:TetR/AcrR family transcriptional regulator [Chitinophaga arvensicola]SEW52702.1 DNA-binding transcriptional regulator, AcrR family [Chitinophaga arvensicola]